MARWSGGTFSLGSGEVVDGSISSSTKIDADKLQHIFRHGTNFDLAIGGTPATLEEIVWVATTAGTIRGVHALLNDTGTTTDIDFECKKNGTTVLSAAINFTHADGDKAVKDGTVSVTTFVADDIISLGMTVTTSTGAQGPYAWIDVEENAS